MLFCFYYRNKTKQKNPSMCVQYIFLDHFRFNKNSIKYSFLLDYSKNKKSKLREAVRSNTILGKSMGRGHHLRASFLIGSEPEVLFVSVGVCSGKRHNRWLHGLTVSRLLGDSSDICTAGPAKSTRAPRVGVWRRFNQKCIPNRMSEQHAKSTCSSRGRTPNGLGCCLRHNKTDTSGSSCFPLHTGWKKRT